MVPFPVVEIPANAIVTFHLKKVKHHEQNQRVEDAFSKLMLRPKEKRGYSMLCVQEGTTTTLPGKKVESRNYKTHILEFNVYNVQLNLPAPQQRTITNFIKVTNLRFKQYGVLFYLG